MTLSTTEEDDAVHRSPMITVARGPGVPPAAQVLEQVRAAGLLARDEVASRTGLSTATVGRAVGQLVGAGLLRHRPDRARPGAVGRPGTPLEVDPDRYVTLGFHLGRGVATVALGDLTGRVVAERAVGRAPGAPPDLDGMARTAAELLGGQSGRAPLAAGLVAPWRDLGLEPAATGRALHELVGLEVRTGDHVAAIAAAEFFHRRHGTPGVTLYVYARNSIGFATAVDKGRQTEVSRALSLTHFPTGSDARCPCGARGCLEVTAGDHALAAAVHAAGLVPEAEIGAVHERAGVPAVREHLVRRARVLGRATAVVRDMIAPDRMVLVGQAFTGRPELLSEVTDAFEEASALGPVEMSVTRFGGGVQAIAACAVALAPVYDDPLGVVPRLRRCAQPVGA